MDPAAQKRRRQGLRLFWALVAAVVLLPLSLGLYVTFGPNPPIRISKPTTYITSPLDEDGLPNYAAALLAELRKGVTPENNGAVPFLQAMWPSGDDSFVYSATDAEALCEELGMPIPTGAAFNEDFWSDRMNEQEQLLFNQRMQSVPLAVRSDTDFAEEIGLLAHERPWTSSDLPYLSDWIRSHRVGFELLFEAAERDTWYLPDPQWLRCGSGACVGGTSIRGLLELTSACRYLQLLTMNAAGEGRHAEAVRSVLSILRLSHLYSVAVRSDTPALWSHEIAALWTIRELCRPSDLPQSDLKHLLSELERLPPPARRYSLNRDRLFFLDWAVRVSLGEYPLENESTLIKWLADRATVDWGLVLRSINAMYDNVAAAENLPTHAKRDSAIALIENETLRRQAAIDQLHTTPLRLLTPQSRAGVVADLLIAKHGHLGCRGMLELQESSQVEWELTRLVVALAIHQREHGDFPAALAALSPEVLDKLPSDPYGSPFQYDKLDDGYLLYSTGPNGRDDRGSNEGGSGAGYGPQAFEGIRFDYYLDPGEKPAPSEQADYDLVKQIPPGADDHAIRMPLPIEPWPWEKQPAKSE